MLESRGEAATTCWECDATAERPVTVTLRTHDGHVGTLLLCDACYRTHCLPLAAEPAEGIEPGHVTVVIEARDG
jgi:hypothetical protein